MDDLEHLEHTNFSYSGNAFIKLFSLDTIAHALKAQLLKTAQKLGQNAESFPIFPSK